MAVAVVAAPLLPQPAAAVGPPAASAPEAEERDDGRRPAEAPILWWEPAPTTPGPVRDDGDAAPVAARRAGGEVLPVLPLGAGLACLGLGLGILGYRLRE
ncbi:hypothetical protein [Streptomyces millisiae]|uniref:Uncharacterized protein n=1 Tax=Streptomyces millisiae TaxID=3075542 RepID=A0ABU2LTE9_9ACTN|nr:hypothetical protein [Streptomyces sp. DSM 44918]MDT0320869.1 hypothetical protein [Streptomyces sp. DSM 44918]